VTIGEQVVDILVQVRVASIAAARQDSFTESICAIEEPLMCHFLAIPSGDVGISNNEFEYVGRFPPTINLPLFFSVCITIQSNLNDRAATMSILRRNQVEVKQTGSVTDVPNNDIARCMYYLSCVCNTVECNEGQIRRYTDYRNYRNLSNSEHEIVFKLCLTLSPDEFEDKVFFESDALCGNYGNEFYEIGQVRHVLMAVQSVVVAGRTRQVNSIMT
jgi:hypothetical protein